MTKELSARNLFWLRFRDFSIAVGHAPENERPLAENLLEYEASVRFLHDHYSILPMRYGTRLKASQLSKMLSAQSDVLLNLLAKTENCSEVLIRWILPPQHCSQIHSNSISEESAKPQSGRDYLIKKLNASKIAQEAEKQILAVKTYIAFELQHLAKGVHAYTKAIPNKPHAIENTPPPLVLAVDLLVNKNDVNNVISRSKCLSVLEELPISVRGPLPLYTFTHVSFETDSSLKCKDTQSHESSMQPPFLDAN